MQKSRETARRARTNLQQQEIEIVRRKANAAAMRMSRETARRARSNLQQQEIEKAKAINTVVRRKAMTAAMRKARENSTYRTPEKERDNQRKRIILSTPSRKDEIQERNTEVQRKRRRLVEPTYDIILQKYKEKIRCAPSHICSCCGCLWYEKSTNITSEELLKNSGCTEDFIKTILHVPQVLHRLCGTCHNNVRKKRIPRLCLSNGFDFPVVPEELQGLSPLEERLVALRIPFMQIRLLGCDRQSSLRGNVVNVENDLDICAEVLPRRFNETSTVQVQFMRRMNYKQPYMYETIRPIKVYKAAKYLMGTELYISENVALSEDWSGYTEEATMDFICQEHNSNSTETNDHEDTESGTTEVSDFEDPENVCNMGAEETLVFNEKDIRVIRIAPGEGKTPKHLHFDVNAEVMSFPSIYCGTLRKFKDKIRISYTDIAKSELHRYDRRACAPTKLLYSFKRSFNEKVSQAIQICLRQKCGNKTQLTAGSFRHPEFIEQLVNRDDGYAVFKNIRSSPSYWKEKTKKVLAMVRQLGKCTFFITLSAAETKWAELLVMLKKIVKNEDITEEQAAAMSFDEISDLIRNDPVTCMRHFDHKYRALLHELLKEKFGLFSPYTLQDYFSRLEFQMRGSPHSHGLYWIKDAPIYVEGDCQSESDCAQFIDTFITCERCEEGEMEKFIGYQIHKHSKTCEKKLVRGQKCRFGFPNPPMKITMILTPIPKDSNPKTVSSARELFNKIQIKLDSMGRSFKEDIDYEKFLESLETNHDDYILAVRSSIKRSTVFLKRSTSSIFVNPYNRKLLEAWGANIDVQFVLDPYACAKYTVGYILKSEGGVSKLLQAATVDARKKDSAVRDKLKKFASVLINGSEVSAQEATAFLLGIPNAYCSRVDVFVNTGPPDERIRILKSQDQLENLEEDSEDIYAKGLIDHYTKRPHELEHLCLAEFATKFNFSKSFKGSSTGTTVEPDVHGSDGEEVTVESDIETVTEDLQRRGTLKQYKLLDSSGYVKEKKEHKILRFRHYGKAQDPVNYNRERIMLFVPWRDESKELVEIDAIKEADIHKMEILKNSEPFFCKDFDHESLRALVEEMTEDDNEENENNAALVDDDMEALEDEEVEDNNIMTEIIMGNKRGEQFLPPRLLETEKYRKIMRSLNDKQRRYVLNALHLLKTSKTPFYHFLSGGAGVGKSHVITALVQSYIYYRNREIHLKRSKTY